VLQIDRGNRKRVGEPSSIDQPRANGVLYRSSMPEGHPRSRICPLTRDFRPANSGRSARVTLITTSRARRTIRFYATHLCLPIECNIMIVRLAQTTNYHSFVNIPSKHTKLVIRHTYIQKGSPYQKLGLAESRRLAGK